MVSLMEVARFELLPALVLTCDNIPVTIHVIDLSRKPGNFCNDFFYY